MPTSIIGAVAAPIVGAAAGSLFGGGGGAQAEIPPDLRGLRSEQIDLLRYLMGYGNLNQPTAFTGPQNPLNVPYLNGTDQRNPFWPPADTGGWDAVRARFGGGGGGEGFPTMPTNPLGGASPPSGWTPPASSPPSVGSPTGGLTPRTATDAGPNINVAQAPTGGMTPGNAAPGGAPGSSPGALPPGARLEQFFGPLGMPQSALQQQAVGQIGTFLSDANNPFNRTQQQSYDVLGNILGSNPGQPVIDALQPSFQRNLAEANQQGGRFGTANAVLRSRALDDFNLLAAQAAQQGVNQQMQAANLGNILGNDQLARLAGIFGIGGQEAQQADVETQRRIQLLQSLMATAQGASFGQPVSVTPSGAQQGLQAGMQFASLLPFLLNRGGNG